MAQPRKLILNFHGVGPVTRDVDNGERNCWLERAAFDAVLDLVHGHSHVRLTVDDGNASDHDQILPSLLARGLMADFFVCSARIDQPTFLSHAQLRTLRDRGMGIGSHGATHRAWRGLPPEELRVELTDSRVALEEACGAPVTTAACPFGSYDRRVLNELKRAGYRRVYTSDGGLADDDAWLQPRTTITRGMRMEEIRQLIDHGPGRIRQISISLRKTLKRLR
ncbi:MAG: polysaccharide deacetylase family protein [Verrucomicrobia bacterium]|nr:polysaccharide deacetylase family protein [Verrucomicrobiota bacterium]